MRYSPTRSTHPSLETRRGPSNNQMAPISQRPLARMATLIMGTLGALMIASPPGFAQFGNGAVIVTVPSSSDPSSEQAPPKSTEPAPRSKKTPTAKRQSQPTRRRASAAPVTKNSSADKLKIALIVNDDPITEYEISQRSALLAGQAGLGKQAQENFQRLIKRADTNTRLRAILQETVEQNSGRSREQILALFEKRKKAYAVSLQQQAIAMARSSVMPGMRHKATQELIEERLKLQAAEQAKTLISKQQLDEVMSGIAKRNNLTYAAFKAQLQKQGTDINAMRTRIRAQMSWGRLINAKFGRFVDVNQKTIDESVIGGDEAAKVSLHLHRLVFKLPSKIDQRIIAQRMLEAEQIRANFKGCAETSNLSRGVSELVFQDMGYRVAAEVAEPTRSLLLNARDGEMAPPVATEAGVALYAVCGRRAGTKSFEAREAAERNLRAQGTEIYGRKYLNDLRREANIEYRNR